MGHHGVAFAVGFQDFGGAEGYAEAASLAPVVEDVDFASRHLAGFG